MNTNCKVVYTNLARNESINCQHQYTQQYHLIPQEREKK